MHPRVTVRCRSEVTRLDGTDFLEEISVTDRATGTTRAQPCSGVERINKGHLRLVDHGLRDLGIIAADHDRPGYALVPAASRWR